ncbi:MAG: alpha/beta hydrolase, partial [Verrucomicrobiota bacterium]
WIHEYSPYHLLDANDPPTYLYYHDIPELGREAKDPTHTGNYGLGLKQRCDELGIECEIVHKGSPNPKYRRTSDFLITKLLSHNN